MITFCVRRAGRVVAEGTIKKEDPPITVVLPVRPGGARLTGIVVGLEMIIGEGTCGAGVFGGWPHMIELIIAPSDAVDDAGGGLFAGGLFAGGLYGGGLFAGGLFAGGLLVCGAFDWSGFGIGIGVVEAGEFGVFEVTDTSGGPCCWLFAAPGGVTMTTVELVKSPPAYCTVGNTLSQEVIWIMDGPPGRQEASPGYCELYSLLETKKSRRVCGT
jgi:hypothetical protein